MNVTIGLALVAFCFFHIEGVRALGFGGYFGKFFPLREFYQGVGAGIIALFVGLIELMLEFVKPLTLSIRTSSATSTVARWRSASSWR